MPPITSISVFEIIAVYFTNNYWNSLYSTALDIWEQERYDSLDAAYTTVIKRYNSAFCRVPNQNERINSNYHRICEDLYQHYQEYLRIRDSYNGFIENIVKFLVPNDYTVSHDKKEKIFQNILSKSLTRFTMFISTEFVGTIVDASIRKNQEKSMEHCQTLKKKFIDLLVQERNNFCSLLLAKSSGVDIHNPNEMSSISKNACDKLSAHIKQLIEEKAEIIRERNQYARLAQTYKNMLMEREKMSQPPQASFAKHTNGFRNRPRLNWRKSRTDDEIKSIEPADSGSDSHGDGGSDSSNDNSSSDGDNVIEKLENKEFRDDEMPDSKDDHQMADRNEEFNFATTSELQADE